MIEDRRERNAPQKPYDWKDIVQRSKMKAMGNNNKERTFITHLHETKIDSSVFRSDFSQKRGKKGSDTPKKTQKTFKGDK